ncbi:hypothetical protein Vadar_018107 [Vaccinium darrowii]|uniref:Uncharacterized protein n=1 Tax=Vaccinium darrowii TaxID=229202 RepID=A0ACB7YWI0_9ERIC|nr:hypothetical protein Vadar_018107 [Vaccinium darrowii]
MQLANVVPDKVIFVRVLLACGYVGAFGMGKMVHEFIESSRFHIDLKLGTALVDVDKGMKYFKSMKDVHGISPEPEHYRCMVDSLGRAGRLQEARELIRTEDPTSGFERPITVSEVEPLVKDFSRRWKAAIALMHNVVITSFSNFFCGMEILRASLTQLLLYYTRLSDCIKRVVGGSSQNKDLVSISSIIVKDFNYS